MTPYSNKFSVVTIALGNDLLPVQSQAITCRVGSIQFHNWNYSSIQIPELEMELKMEMEMQWNPSIKATQDGGLSKEVAFMRGKINMICKEWCMEMDQILQL